MKAVVGVAGPCRNIRNGTVSLCNIHVMRSIQVRLVRESGKQGRSRRLLWDVQELEKLLSSIAGMISYLNTIYTSNFTI